eukprot:m.49556 g.49556  ORF g.49556 m.49556 type:complete len:277 (-) comp13356_c1_seq2:567-1397(-)
MSLMLSSDCLLSQLASHGSPSDNYEGGMLPSPSSDGASLVNFDELDLSLTPSGNTTAGDLAYFESLISPEHAGATSELLNIVDPEDIVPTSDYHSSANVVQDPPEDNGASPFEVVGVQDVKDIKPSLRSTRGTKRTSKRRSGRKQAAPAQDSEDEYQPSDDGANPPKRAHRAGKEPNRNAVMAKLNREKKKAYVNSLEDRIANLEQDKAAALKQVAEQKIAWDRAQAEIVRLQTAVKASPAIAQVLRALGNDKALSFGQGQPTDTIPVQLNLSVNL